MTRTRAPPPPAPGFGNSYKGLVKESDVLHPVNKRLSDDDWPTFTLSDATVYTKQYEDLANLLLVEKKGPFPIRGRMTVDYSDEGQVSARMCLPRSRAHCRMFANLCPISSPLATQTETCQHRDSGL